MSSEEPATSSPYNLRRQIARKRLGQDSFLPMGHGSLVRSLRSLKDSGQSTYPVLLAAPSVIDAAESPGLLERVPGEQLLVEAQRLRWSDVACCRQQYHRHQVDLSFADELSYHGPHH